ncbi:MAG: acyl-CoA dehydrogenase family protein [Chloroflexi bacterium]|nr:acyl-CoA dehydrogenase family protein [Chloroflexota bacterium]
MQEQMLTDEHRMFRDAFRKFVEKEIAPYHAQWEKDGQVDKRIWRKAGENGFLGMDVPEEYGGLGVKDFRYNTLIAEELTRVGASGVGYGLHNDIVIPYVLDYGTEAQKQAWLPKLASGEWVSAIAMTEPNTGSDLARVRTTAVLDGDEWVINGQKTFITNGIHSDFVIVVCKTKQDAGAHGISLIVVEEGRAGFERGRNLEKIGLHAQDTAELFFRDVRVPATNLLGGENKGFYHLMQQLPQERLSIAVLAVASAEVSLEQTLTYCKERTAFGQPIGSFQNSRFKLAEMKTEIEIGRVFVDNCINLLNVGQLSTETASMAKWWCTELQGRVIDQCVQLHGGYGYMLEYPIARAFGDARVQRIYGGTNEIMKEIIGRSLGV